nr:thrombospondin-related anonymous protein 1 [Babesia orientalis]
MIGYNKIWGYVPILHFVFLVATGLRVVVGQDFSELKAKQCKKQLDFSIVVDESASIKDEQWKGQMIPFLRNLIQTIDLDNSDIRLSLTTYSTPARQIFTFLDEAASNTRLALNKLDWMAGTKARHGMTYTGRALNFVRKAILPYGRKNVPKALLLITDGGSSDGSYTAQTAAMLRDEGVYVMVIGVGNINVAECRGIVGCDGVMDCPMFKHTNWKDIVNLFYGLMKEVCDVLPQDAVCEPVWGEWSDCNAECNSTGVRTRNILDLHMIQKPVNGSNGQPGQTCEEQKLNFPPESEGCIKKCQHEPVPTPEIATSDADELPAPESVNPEEKDHDNTHTDDHAPEVPPMPSSPDTEHDPKDLTETDMLDERKAGSPEPTHDLSEDEALRRKLEKQREEDLMKEWMLQRTLKDQKEREMNADVEDSAPEHAITPESHVGEAHTDEAQPLNNPALRREIYDNHPEESSRDDIQGELPDSEGDQEDGEKPKGESTGMLYQVHFKSLTGRSTSNTTKIAGGALLGLVLLGAGGGYAMYKKNKTPTMDTESGDYTGADESTQPMKDGETYTVTEFDNNIWGEAA